MKTANQLAKMLRNREISSVEITKASFERTNGPAKKVGSYITLNQEKALKRAEEIDELFAKGQDLSPLAGIPIAVKDNIITKDIKTTAASKMLENFIPPYNATVTEKLLKSGLIITGKVNLDEFAMGSSCENSALVKTCNPHDLSRVPGGSSGGSTAVVSSGEVSLSLGSDTGGSIRQPASFCGVFGLKPTYGSVSRYGLIAFASSLDQIGPIARCTEDIAMLADTIYGYDKMDSTSEKQEDKNFYKNLKSDVRGMKIGLPKQYFGDGISEEVRTCIMKAIETYKKMGAEIIPISLDMAKHALPVYYILSSAEASSNLARFDGVKYGYRAKDYTDLMDLYVKSRSQGFGEEVKRRIMLGNYVLSSGYYDAYYNKGKIAQKRIRQEFETAFKSCDVILTPVCPTTAYKFGEKTKNPVEMYASDICTVSVNIAGLPAISQPCGFDSNKLPIGMQIIGPHFGEQTILNAAFAFEKETGLSNIIAGLEA